jgi:transmembrane sensor
MTAGTSARFPSGDSDGQTRAALDAAAADWLIAHDRGLTAAEQREFERWLATGPREAQAWDEAQRAWSKLDRLPELSPVAAVGRARMRARTWLAAAAAAAAAVALFFVVQPQSSHETIASMPGLVRHAPELRTLSDGTLVRLNVDSAVTEHFTAGWRRVRLERGEAHFTVVKDSSRPFVVEAGRMAVQAVGTAFNVRLSPAEVDVLVTEGRVRLDSQAQSDSAGAQPLASTGVKLPRAAPESSLLVAGQRAVVGLGGGTPEPDIQDVTAAEIARLLDWQVERLQFNDLPLSRVAAELNARNPVRLIVDPAVADIPVAGSFNATNVDVFVSFLEAGFHVAAERRSDGTIYLRKAP